MFLLLKAPTVSLPRNVRKDNKQALIRYGGYIFREIENDPQKGTITVQNLNRQPFGKHPSAPRILVLNTKDIELGHVEEGSTEPSNDDDVHLLSTYTLDSNHNSTETANAQQVDSESLSGGGARGDPSLSTEKLMKWESVIDPGQPDVKKGSSVLLKTNGQWRPGVVTDVHPSGNCRCIVYDASLDAQAKQAAKRLFAPENIKPLVHKQNDMVRHKGYVFRLVDVMRTHEFSEPEYIIQNLNRKPFGKGIEAPYLHKVRISEITF